MQLHALMCVETTIPHGRLKVKTIGRTETNLDFRAEILQTFALRFFGKFKTLKRILEISDLY